MKTYGQLIGELDENQREASRIGTNAVIAAGAGSGKTRVLAARFVHLVIEKEMPVDEILALTFTQKAASEMYERIYSTLRDIDHPLAREAIASFHLARISTIDSFCNSIARNACRRYGVSPDFEIDNDRATSLAEELALPFFLEHRTSPAIRQFMKRYGLAELAPSLFADTMVRFSPVSSPLDFEAFLAVQRKEIAARFPKSAKAILDLMRTLKELPPAEGKTWIKVTAALADLPGLPAAEDPQSVAGFIAACKRLRSIPVPSNGKDPGIVMLKELLPDFKKRLLPEFLSLANYILNEKFVIATFDLLAEFQTLYHRTKRAEGIMTFADVSRLALDALVSDPLLRRSYKESIGAVMIDEFQDDNEMQRNLLFLIAEKKERNDRSVPEADELCPDKLFFVGDEKQSIYRFRGADVSVFRKLAQDLGLSGGPELGINYRTESDLIAAFNHIFPRVFLNPAFYDSGTYPLYEASFKPIDASRNTEGIESVLDVLVVNEANFDAGDFLQLSPTDTEAAEVAIRIRDLVEKAVPIRGKDGIRPCAWSDMAILFRSGTKQQYYEKHLRENGIPYQAESLRGLFGDAPVNDLYALLRLAVYPADNSAYAVLLRSPFVTLSDAGFALAMIDRTAARFENRPMPPPFSEALEASLDPEDRPRFARARALWLDIRDKADRLSAAELVSRLWYDEGYRYAILDDCSLHRYTELYDYFFELARQADEKGETLATFLDRIAALMASGEKIEGLDIPVERAGGVRLMTVHKSKGLEFPVVFLVDCGNYGNTDRNTAPVYYSEETGISVNTGGAEEADAASANWFYEKGREEEKNKGQAEIKRLLYVAMTRAETRLCLSGTVNLAGDEAAEDEGDASGDQGIEGDILALISTALDKKDRKAGKDGKPPVKRSFFDFLFPALVPDGIPALSITEILPRRRSAALPAANAAASASGLAALYGSLPLASYHSSPRTRFSATALQALAVGKPAVPAPAAQTATADEKPDMADPLDRLLKATVTSAADFGIYAHKTIEARFTGFPAFMPAELRPAAEAMADRFLASELGKKALSAKWKENEYGFVTRYEFADRQLTVSGQIDLIFEFDGKVYVVDYKTDKSEDPEVHAEQMAVYRKAACDLYGKEIETWLFYLRSGNAVLVR